MKATSALVCTSFLGVWFIHVAKWKEDTGLQNDLAPGLKLRRGCRLHRLVAGLG